MQKISVLGCGWLGLPLAETLLTNYQVLGSSTNTDTLNNLSKIGVQPFLITLDALNLNVLQLFLQADILIITIPPKSDDLVKNIKNLIAQVEKSPIKKVLYCSSISIYGNQTGIITEKTLAQPITENAKKMVKIEQMLLQNSSFETIILRFGGLIGLQRHPAKHLSNKTLKQPNTPINLIHLTDCIGAIQTIIAQQLTGVFNLVTPHHPTKKEYYTTICKQLQIPAPLCNTGVKIMEAKIISSEKINNFYQFKNEKLSLFN